MSSLLIHYTGKTCYYIEMDPPTNTIVGKSVVDGSKLSVAVENGVIVEVKRDPGSPTEELPYVAPGMIDMQVNGYMGRGYTLPDFDDQQLYDMVGYLAAAGTTQQTATIVTSPRDRICRNLEVFSNTCAGNRDMAAAIPGIHLEGPFISAEEGPRGAHDPEYIRDPTIEEFREWQDAASGRICMVTLAPERKGAIEFIEALVDGGVIAAIGHTGATREDIRRAIEAGASYSTHLGNGCHAMIPRHDNYIWEQLAADELYMGIIPDGFHLPPSTMKALARAKGFDKTVLVSDVSRMGGLEPGDYHWGGIQVRVHPDGHLNVIDTPFLAGAGHLLDWSLVKFIRSAGCSLADGLALCTENPAKILGLDSGWLQPGKAAHMFQFGHHGSEDRLAVQKVWREGVEIYPG